jgi:hypothetical protein
MVQDTSGVRDGGREREGMEYMWCRGEQYRAEKSRKHDGK